MELSNLRPAEGSNIATLSEEVVDMVQEMEKLQVKDIKDRKARSGGGVRPGIRRWTDAFIQTYS